MAALEMQPRYVAALTQTDQHWGAIVDLIKPRGQIAMIDDPENLDIAAIKLKALTLTWEFKFARSMFQTEDMHVQHDLLNRVSELVDDGTLVSTSNFHAGVLSVENLVKAHQKQESGSTIGKIVLDALVLPTADGASQRQNLLTISSGMAACGAESLSA